MTPDIVDRLIRATTNLAPGKAVAYAPISLLVIAATEIEGLRELAAEVARLRSIIHRAESHLLSYDTRGAITILRELNEGEDEGER